MFLEPIFFVQGNLTYATPLKRKLPTHNKVKVAHINPTQTESSPTIRLKLILILHKVQPNGTGHVLLGWSGRETVLDTETPPRHTQ